MNEARPENAIYISGPMTGHEDYNRPAFNRHAQTMRRAGCTVNNPGEVLIENGEYHDYMLVDLDMLLKSTEVHALTNWDKSNGAGIEAIVAAVCRIPVYPADFPGPEIKRSKLLMTGIRSLVNMLEDALKEEAQGAQSNG